MIKESLFPSEVYLCRPDGVDAILSYYNKICTKDIQGGNASNQGGWQSIKTLHNDPRFVSIVNMLTTQLKSIVHSENVIPVIDALWYNINPPKSYNTTHIHPSSWYSGAFYLQTTPTSGSIVFTDPRPGAVFDENRVLTESDKMAKEYLPVPGTLILFPSWLPHYVRQNESNTDKVCISFNTHLVSKKDVHA